MNFNDGILYVFMALLAYIVDKIITGLTDKLDQSIHQKRIIKHGIASLLIVVIWLTLYFFINQTSVFNLSEEDKIGLLLILVFSFIYLNLNATISTFLKKKFFQSKSEKCFCYIMVIVNIVMAIILVLISAIVFTGNSIITAETQAIVKYDNEQYEITIPKDTFFYFESKKIEESPNLSKINDILEPINSTSEYSLHPNTKILLKKGTYVKYDDSNSVVEIKDGSSQSKIKFYLTSKSVSQLKRDTVVQLKKSTTVILDRTNGFLTIPAINVYFIALCLVIYYFLKSVGLPKTVAID